MITATFGAGGAYAKLSDAIVALLPSGSAWANDYEFVQVGNCVQGTTGVSFGSRLYMNGHTLTIKNNNPHNGNPNTGYTITGSSNWEIPGSSGTIFTGIINFNDLNLAFSSGTLNFTDLYSSSAITQTTYINRCIVKGSGIATRGNPLKIISSKITAFTCTHHAPVANPIIIENSTIAGLADANNTENLVIRNTFASQWMDVGGCLGYNNASVYAAPAGGWAAGSSGNIYGIVLANEVKSTDPTNDEWLFLKNSYGDGGVLAKSGMLPLYVTEDIAGLAIPDSNGYYPIGCHRCLLSEKSVPKSSIMAMSGNNLYSIGRKDQFGDDVESLLITNNEGNTNSDGTERFVDVLINS
jgi:hypothetical protein